MSLAADSEDGNGFQLEKLRLNFSSCFRVCVLAHLQIIDINDHDLFSHCKLRLCLPLGVQRKCSKWIKLATTSFQDSFGPKIHEIPKT